LGVLTKIIIIINNGKGERKKKNKNKNKETWNKETKKLESGRHSVKSKKESALKELLISENFILGK
jgi:hypothetical protein